MSKTVLVIGTGTIGEPLIGLLSRLKSDLGIDSVIFHKRTPLDYEVAKVNSLIRQNANLAVNADRWREFQELGHEPKYTFEEALRLADVIIDCTPAGNENKDKHYLGLDAEASKRRVFIAQGSEKGFGPPYAYGINDNILGQLQSHRFIQVVSCNTHAIGRLIKSLNPKLDKNLISSDFVCIRRANDTSQNSGFTPSPTLGEHTDKDYGTHHARDVSDLLSTVTGKPTNILSSAMKVNSQYMHAIRFAITLNENLTKTDVIERFRQDQFVTLTRHKTANKVFSYGRDHGFYGRIYNQVVVCMPSISTFPGRESKETLVTGFAFTPQDGNSLLSSAAACCYGLYDNDYVNYLSPILEFLENEV